MGRELRRKQAKKERKSLEKEEIIEEKHLKRYLIIITIIIIIIAAIYIISSAFITKELEFFNKKETKEITNKETKNDEILASETFKQSEEEYYVYFYDFTEKENIISETVMSKLAYSKLYKVNTASSMNANYVSDTSNKKAKKLSELKVISPTLIKITGGTITEYYEKEEITNKLR